MSNRPSFTHMLTLKGGIDDDLSPLEDAVHDHSDIDQDTLRHYTAHSAQEALRVLSQIERDARLVMIAPYGTAPLSADRDDCDFSNQDLARKWTELSRGGTNYQTYAGLLGYVVGRAFEAVPDTRVVLAPHLGDFSGWKSRMIASIFEDRLPQVFVFSHSSIVFDRIVDARSDLGSF